MLPVVLIGHQGYESRLFQLKVQSFRVILFMVFIFHQKSDCVGVADYWGSKLLDRKAEGNTKVHFLWREDIEHCHARPRR